MRRDACGRSPPMDEATLRAIAERHGFLAARGPHTGEGSASRLIDALLAGEVVTLALSPADRRRLVAWLDETPPPAGRLATVLHSMATQLRPTLPTAAKTAPRAPAPAAVVTATTPPTMRRGHLTTDEAARRLDLSPARVQELARAGEIGRKVDGRWAFTEREITRVKGERDRRALRLSLTPTRTQKRTTRRRRPSSGAGSSGRPTRADVQAMGYLDQLLAEERRLEQTYQLPFRAPQRVATTVHACTRCGQDLLLLIVGDHARDEEGLLAYGRLMRAAIVARGLPAYVLGAPAGDGARDDTPSLLCQVWPEAGEPRRVTPSTWDSLVEQWSQAHCPL